MIDLWYKNAVVYCLDVDTFMDSNGDGIGDFQGLRSRLDHLEALGATALWLLPFYPSPNRDNGYDVTDFYGVDRRLGTLGDFVDAMRAARDRGMRVLVDLVVNHTSIDHPWFQEARRDPRSRYRDWYIWSKEKPENADEGVIFPGIQESTWTWDETAGEWYFHRFYKHQPDLNIANPAVREEIERIMGFWLELGVSGFRIDAVPFLIEPPPSGTPESWSDPHCYLTELRAFLTWRKAEAVLLAEANIPMDKVDEYFGRGDRMHMIFNFLLNQHLYLALVREEAEPITRILREMPPIPLEGQWATFLRNHDELDLGRLEDDEREEVFAAFGPEPEMQIYHRGIRRRLAPMLGGDARRLALAYSLLFALPGTPVLWYGEEIGMGDDLSLPERNSVRTPMQWSDDENAGFSTSDPGSLIRPVVRDGPFRYQRVNAAAQRHVADSTMERVQRLVRTRRACPEIGWGSTRILDTGEKSVLAVRYDWQGGTVVTLHNLAGTPVEAKLDLGDGCGPLLPLTGLRDDRSPRDPSKPIRLDAYDFAWLRLRAEA